MLLNCNIQMPALSVLRRRAIAERAAAVAAEPSDVYYAGEALEWVNEYKYLGLILTKGFRGCVHQAGSACTRRSDASRGWCP